MIESLKETVKVKRAKKVRKKERAKDNAMEIEIIKQKN